MNFLKFHTIVMTAFAVMACLVGCEKEPDKEQEPELNEALELIVDVEDVNYTSAKIKVTHNGAKSDTWYGFLTDMVGSDEEELINDAIDAYMNGESDEGLRKSKNYVTVFKELNPGTKYKYIAFGLTADGKSYGTSASVEFETIADSNEGGSEEGGNVDTGDVVNGMRKNSAWTVNYVGEGVLYEKEYDHVVTVNSTDRNTYAITVVYASLWNVNDLYDMAVMFADDMVAYIEEYNDYYGTSYTVADLLYKGTASDAFNLDPGYYMAVAIGITPEGKVSGLYAVSEVFEVKEQIPTEEYKSWLGDWTIVGENNVEFNVTFSKHVTNKSFWVYGWEGFEDIPIDVEYSKERNDVIFYAQPVAQNYYLEEWDMYANMYFLGCDVENQFYTTESGNYNIAIAGILDDGQRALVRYGVNDIGYPKFTTMSYAAEIDGDYYFLTETEDLPSFRGIAGMYPASGTSSTKTTGSVHSNCNRHSVSLLREERLNFYTPDNLGNMLVIR